MDGGAPRSERAEGIAMPLGEWAEVDAGGEGGREAA